MSQKYEKPNWWLEDPMQNLIRVADARFDSHLRKMEARKK